MAADRDAGSEGGSLLERIRAILELDPTAPALEFEGRWYSWADIANTVDTVAECAASLSLAPGSQVGLLVRNRPSSVGLLLGALCARTTVVIVNAHFGAERASADLADLDLPLIAGEVADVAALVTSQQRDRSAVLEIADLGTEAKLDGDGAAATAEPMAGVAVRMLTSGTTGPPKRIELTFDVLERVLRGAKHYESDAKEDLRLRDGVAVVNSPLVHLGGLFRILQAVSDGRRMALLERFTVDEWVDRVKKYQPRTASLVPTALRMVLDADVDADDLASLRSVVSGTAPLSPDVADEFMERYGVPVLTNYAATEFGGAVAGWNVKDHQKFWSSKRGSVGRAHAGCELRIVDETTRDVLPPGEVGLLEVRANQLQRDDWIATTDLARLDDDGFLWIVGRADQTIIRGGLKVQPETVRVALEHHPSVRAAAVVGVDDERLGQVPVAVVELVQKDAVDEAALLAHTKDFLTPYEMPVAVRFVDAMPRTDAAKVDLRTVRELVSPADAETRRSGG